MANNPTASCGIRSDGPIGLGMSTHEDYVEIEEPPSAIDRGLICTQKSVTIRPENLGKGERFLLDLQYGSQEGEDRYSPARSMVEGFNGYTKDGTHEAIAEKVNRRVRGFAANALVAAVTLMATNVRKIRAWLLAEKPLPSEPKPRPTRHGDFREPPHWVREAESGPGWDPDYGNQQQPE